jgi:hypothetical protein
MKPRAQAFHMKYLLAKFALESPSDFFGTFDSNVDDRSFSRLWADCGEEFEPVERVENTGTSVWRSLTAPGGFEILILTFPTPEDTGEAYYVGAVRMSESECRVFCLERSAASSETGDSTMMAELAPHGRMNWGAGPNPTREEFVARVKAIISDPTATPLSFLPIRLV